MRIRLQHDVKSTSILVIKKSVCEMDYVTSVTSFKYSTATLTGPKNH